MQNRCKKKACKIYCRRGASPPHPLDTSRWKQIDQRQEVGRYWRHWQKKEVQKHAKIIKISLKWQPISMKTQWKIKVESRMRFWIVLGWPWGGLGVPNGRFWEPKPSKYQQNGDQNRSKIDENSSLRCRCVFGAFLGRQSGQPIQLDWTTLATIFDKKSKKCHPKRHPKIDAEKVSKNDEKSIQTIPKWMPKSMIWLPKSSISHSKAAPKTDFKNASATQPSFG